MLRFVMVAVTGLLMAFQSAPPPDLPPLPSGLVAVLDDPAAARMFDYLALKAGGSDVAALSDAVHARAARPEGGRRCLTEAEMEAQAGLAAAVEATDPAAFAADRTAAEGAWRRWTAFGEDVMAGAPVADPPFSHVAERVAMAGAIDDPRVRDLMTRAARDQLIRRGWEADEEVWGEAAPTPGARGRFQARLSRQMCETDAGNTAWLQADLAAHGWYRVSVFGDQPSRAAWLMIQHADNDPAFQRRMLAILEPLAAEKEVEPWDVALLYDRVAVNSGRPQRYGSQGLCVARNVWGPQPLEDAARVDEFRASVELPPLADYAAHMNRWCADFAG